MSKEKISEKEISTNEEVVEEDQSEQVAKAKVEVEANANANAEAEAEAEIETQAEETKKEPDKDEKDLKIEQLEKELASAKDSFLRKAAELENVRKRVQRERVQLFEEAKAGALEDFMPISDDLIRTLKVAEESKIENSFLEGVKMIAEKFKKVLEKHGVERIDQTGVPFDVNLHDAMMKQPAPDNKNGSDVVLEVLESGYKIGNRTIRHAKVIVSE